MHRENKLQLADNIHLFHAGKSVLSAYCCACRHQTCHNKFVNCTLFIAKERFFFFPPPHSPTSPALTYQLSNDFQPGKKIEREKKTNFECILTFYQDVLCVLVNCDFSFFLVLIQRINLVICCAALSMESLDQLVSASPTTRIFKLNICFKLSCFSLSL